VQFTVVEHGHACYVSAKSRGIAIPTELESQLASLFAKVQIAQKHAKMWSAMGKSRIDSSQQNQDYRIIVDGLQVGH
jgi:hypothetical protein